MLSRALLAKPAPALKAPAQAKSVQAKQAQTYFAQNESEVLSPQFAYSFAGVRTFAEGEPNEGPPGYFANRRLPFPIQAKLTVGGVNDPLEAEADRVADRVMRMPTPGAASHSSDQNVSANSAPTTSADASRLQRKCDCGGTCDDCKTKDKQKEHAKVQMMAAGPSVTGGFEAPPIVHEVLRSSGHPLDAATRAFMEPRFGHDFSHVRIHTDAKATESARAVQAKAYTVGSNVVFGAGQFNSGTRTGQQLLGHELTHVVQQANSGGLQVSQSAPLMVNMPLDNAEREAERVAKSISSSSVLEPIVERPTHGLAREPLDVSALTSELDKTATVGVQIGQGSRKMGLPFIKYLGKHPHGEIAKAADYPIKFKVPADTKKPLNKDELAKVPKADSTPPLSNILLEAHFFPATWPEITGRALVLGGFHGDEHPGRQVTDRLIDNLSQPGGGDIQLAFHTIVVPRVNAGAIEDELHGVKMWRNRCNRQLVDLNRNFPTGNKPANTDCQNTDGAPVQPEVQAVMDVIKTFKPDRILSTHAIHKGDGELIAKGGVYADPNNNPQAIELAKGMAQTLVHPEDRANNQLTTTHFNPVYPGDKPGKTGAGTSLGSWAPTAVDPSKPIPVITMEAPDFNPLGKGPGSEARTVEGFSRPVRAFLEDPVLLDTAADMDIVRDILQLSAAEQVGFLTGMTSSKSDLFRRIKFRIDTAIAKLNALKPPKPLSSGSNLRLFSEDSPTSQAKIDFEKFFLTGDQLTKWDTLPDEYSVQKKGKKTVDRAKWLAETSKKRLDIIIQFSSLPGTSRHHWGTEVDFNSTNVADWQPAAGSKPAGQFFELGQWLQSNAGKAGFVQSYTAGRKGGYQEEPWHYSYAPIAKSLRQMYNDKVNLEKDVKDKIEAEFNKRAKAAKVQMPADFRSGLDQIDITDLVNNIGPGL
jgi:hypothetical protein